MRHRSTKDTIRCLESAEILPTEHNLEHAAIAMARSLRWATVTPCPLGEPRGARLVYLHKILQGQALNECANEIPWR